MPSFTLAAPVHAEIDVRKSRFIGYVMPVADRDAAMTALDALRAGHRSATHVCWALLAGGHSGMSDDGEPSGTAGRPILEVLRHHEFDGVLAAVVRYYGGIKLGTGGLVRAYTDAVAGALAHAVRVERIARIRLVIEIDYADEARVRRWLARQDYALLDSRHGMRVALVVGLPAGEQESACAELGDITQGRAACGAEHMPPM